MAVKGSKINSAINVLRYNHSQQDYSNSSLQKSSKFVLILAQCCALMPVHGVLARDISQIRFKWVSPKTIYSMAVISGIFGLGLLNFLRFLNTGMNFGEIVGVVFFMSAVLAGSLLIKISRNWSYLNQKWLTMEMAMKKYEYQPNLVFKFKVTTIICMSLALGEHMLFLTKNVLMVFKCPLMRTEPVKAYFGAAFSQIFALTEYAHWKAILLEVNK